MVGHEKSPAGRRLAGASSAYLRSAAEQSIDWHPWGSEPFELAKSLRRPVLLDVGATWCHWCHVMDEGTYSDGEVARLIAEHFVAIKVDRDEHPEVDRRYQRQVGALTGEGGWPLTAFLTPDGMAFLGGTYFPAEDGHHGRPGLRRVLREVARIYAEEPEKVDQNTGALRDALARMRSHGPPPGPAVGPTALIAQVAERLATSYDPVHAGFGHAPKFPHPSGLSFLLWSSFATGDARSAARARETLLRMADGGLFDQLGGGFHRYSVDEGWHVPHFEKMAIDNAALLGTYVEGAARFADARLEETAGRTARWIVEVLERPDGGFGASQDADNAPGDDGRFFTWSRAELRAILSEDELKAVTRHFGIGTEGRMPQDPDQNVLYRLMPVAEVARTIGRPVEEVERTIAGATAKMQEARARRPVPFVDPARYGLINGAL
ncbi:MAG TPA: DUF255 domain-containing protein, partial [Thermoplasmata archaeon]|nr:DUF255 domain-containing protein [Thermoplasmata archaeon]